MWTRVTSRHSPWRVEFMWRSFEEVISTREELRVRWQNLFSVTNYSLLLFAPKLELLSQLARAVSRWEVEDDSDEKN